MKQTGRMTWSLSALLVMALSAPAQRIIDLEAVRLSGAGWPTDPVAHGIIVDSVITVFDPHASIGMVQKGLTNKPVHAFLQGDARKVLKALLDRLHRGGPDGRHVVLKIDTIEVSERTLATREMAFCRFAAEVLERSDSGWISTYSFGTTLARSGGMDATDDHATNIAHALDDCLRRYAGTLDRSRSAGRAISERHLHRPFIRRSTDIAAIVGDRVQQGLYHTYMDFVEGTADTTTLVVQKGSKNTTETTRVLKLRSGGTELMVWGYSDGTRLYVNTGGEYNEVLFGRDGMYTHWSPGPSAEVNAGLVVGAGVFFGALGGGVAALASSGKPGVPVRLDLELVAGTLVRTHGGKSTTRDSEHYFYYTDQSKVDTTACLYLYGGEEGCLRKGQYRVIRLVPRVDPAPVEVRLGEQRIEVALNTNATTDQVYRLTVDPQGALEVDKLNASMASDMLDTIKPENEVK